MYIRTHVYMCVHVYMCACIDTQKSDLVSFDLQAGSENPHSKIQMGPQRAVAGGGTSKYGGSTGKAIHAILSSSLT